MTSPTIWLTDNTGQLLCATGALAREPEAASDVALTKTLPASSGVTYRHVNGSEHVIAFSRILPVDWILAIEEPWDAVDSLLLRTSLVAPLALIPPFLIAVLVIAFGVRRIVRPLQ